MIANPEMIAFLNAMDRADTAYFLDLLRDDEATQRRVMRARDMHAGRQWVKLTARLRLFLGDSSKLSDADMLSLNVCHTVINAMTERLLVRGFDAGAGTAWAQQVWDANAMNVRQDDLHMTALRDGVAYLLVDWPDGATLPRFTTHHRYVDPAYGSDGRGCRVVYENDDPDQPPRYAYKRWTETVYRGGVAYMRYRLTVYYPDGIERYYSDVAGTAWQPYSDEYGESTQPWVDRTGKPLGIPVIAMRNHGDDQEARRAWPLQNGLNKTLVDMTQSSDSSAFEKIFTFGWRMVDKDGKPLPIESGRVYGTDAQGAGVQVERGADFTNFLDLLDFYKISAAQVTDTPAARFLITRQIASEGTQMQQDTPLLNKLRKRQARFGMAYGEALALAARLQATYGLDAPADNLTYGVLWEPLEVRNVKNEMDIAKLKRDVLDIPVDVLQAEAGYEDKDIRKWKTDREARAVQITQQGNGILNTTP